MKKLLIFLILFALLAVPASAEDAELWFDSFDGSGYVYSITVADPSVVSCESRINYKDQGDEPSDGADYSVVFSFTGIGPGRTTAVVSGSSPTAGNLGRHYIVTVDDALNVSVTPDRSILRFRFSESGMTYPDVWLFYRVGPDHYLIYRENSPIKVDPALAEKVLGVIDKYNMISWDGFNESDPYVLDGSSFSLDFILADGTAVHAVGTNSFPDNYYDAKNDILIQFRVADGEPVTDFMGSYRYEGEGAGGNFVLNIDPDGSFTYSEGPLSSYSGSGEWTVEDSWLFLDEDRPDGWMWYYFDIGQDTLGYVAEYSDAFSSVSIPDGGVFFRN